MTVEGKKSTEYFILGIHCNMRVPFSASILLQLSTYSFAAKFTAALAILDSNELLLLYLRAVQTVTYDLELHVI